MDCPQEVSFEERISGELTPTTTLCNELIGEEKRLCPTHPFSWTLVTGLQKSYMSSSQLGWFLQTDEA